MSVLADYVSAMRVRGLSQATIERRVSSLRRLEAAVAPRPLLECTVWDLERWLGSWPAAETRKAYRADVRALFVWARRRGLVDVDPTDELDAPVVPQRLPSPVATSDVHRLIAATHGALRRAVMLGAFAGLRVSEISQVSSGDLVGQVLVVRQGKGRRDRAVPMAPELVEAVAGVVGRLVGPGMRTGDDVSRAIRRAMAALGIEHRPHDLRHAFATEVARLTGGNIPVVQQLLGHASMATTQRYVRLAATAAAVTGLYAA